MALAENQKAASAELKKGRQVMKSLFAFVKESMQRLDSQSLYDPLIATVSVPWANEGGLLMAALAANQIRTMRQELGLEPEKEDQRAA